MISIFNGAEKHHRTLLRCGETPQGTDFSRKTASEVRRNYLIGCFSRFCGAEKHPSIDIYQAVRLLNTHPNTPQKQARSQFVATLEASL